MFSLGTNQPLSTLAVLIRQLPYFGKTALVDRAWPTEKHAATDVLVNAAPPPGTSQVWQLTNTVVHQTTELSFGSLPVLIIRFQNIQKSPDREAILPSHGLRNTAPSRSQSCPGTGLRNKIFNGVAVKPLIHTATPSAEIFETVVASYPQFATRARLADSRRASRLVAIVNHSKVSSMTGRILRPNLLRRRQKGDRSCRLE